jgi:hypothetical protein
MNKDMKHKGFTLILLFGFLLLVSCKSSLFDLCPNTLSKTQFQKSTSAQIPPCHQTKESKSQSNSTGCECSLAYQDYTYTQEFYKYVQLGSSLLSAGRDSISPAFGIPTPFLSRQVTYKFSPSANTFFLTTVRLII